MMEFLFVVMLIFGILQIILFFKIWGMTNDVNNIKENIQRYCNRDFNIKKQCDKNIESNESGKNEQDVNGFKIGDSVKRLSDGKVMKVSSIYENKLFCEIGFGKYKYYEAGEIEKVNNI